MIDATLEKLERLGALASATSGASFHISKGSRTGKWTIHFFNAATKFPNNSLPKALDAAIAWLEDARKPKNTVQKFTIK